MQSMESDVCEWQESNLKAMVDKTLVELDLFIGEQKKFDIENNMILILKENHLNSNILGEALEKLRKSQTLAKYSLFKTALY